MSPFWFILGIVMIWMGIFNRQIVEWLGLKPNSEVFTIPSRKHAIRVIEQIGRLLVIALGMSFLILGFGEALPVYISEKILWGLLGLAVLMIFAMIGITLMNWKSR